MEIFRVEYLKESLMKAQKLFVKKSNEILWKINEEILKRILKKCWEKFQEGLEEEYLKRFQEKSCDESP